MGADIGHEPVAYDRDIGELGEIWICWIDFCDGPEEHISYSRQKVAGNFRNANS